MGELMEMYRKALESRQAGVPVPKVETPKVAPKPPATPSPVAKPMPVDHKSQAAGDDWDGVEDFPAETEVIE